MHGTEEQLQRVEAAFVRRAEDPAGWREALLDQDNHLHSEGQSMGFVCQRGAVVDDGSPVPPHDSRYYWPTDRPGARFPHLGTGPARTGSTIDWFDTAFVLVCGPRADGWRAAGESPAAKAGAPLQVRVLQGLYGPLTIAGDGAVLVRPDGHVAWRATGPGEPEALQRALARVLAGGTEAHPVTPSPLAAGA